ncbi:MAG: M14 family metallocarboxypeptidase [Gemmatimonadetes bacterium]|jgi:murein peptide amidase A|nr:M14 family metallocarboxypeptidase [Gemmatimonadota bacterium]
MRNYDDVVRRIESLDPERVQSRVLAEIEGYPVYAVRLSTRSNRPTAVLMGGTHGDEPAGVEAVLRTLETIDDDWLRHFDFDIIPCLNPYGYVHDTRHNAQDIDVNWSYERDDVPEVQAVRRFVADRRFPFVFDCHEDWESSGYYLYELRRNADLAGPEATRRVRQVCPLNTSPMIEELPAVNGLIAPDADQEIERRGAGIPLVMFFEHTDHLLTSESPTELDLETRVRAHLTALDAIVAAHLSGK